MDRVLRSMVAVLLVGGVLASGATFDARAAGAATAPATQAEGDPVAPGAPTGVTAGPGIRRSLVSWTPPVSDGGSPIIGYEVWVIIGGRVDWKIYVPGADVTSKLMVSLGGGVPTLFGVTAVNAAGLS